MLYQYTDIYHLKEILSQKKIQLSKCDHSQSATNHKNSEYFAYHFFNTYDDYALWKRYADNGLGVVIGFDEVYFPLLGSAENDAEFGLYDPSPSGQGFVFRATLDKEAQILQTPFQHQVNKKIISRAFSSDGKHLFYEIENSGQYCPKIDQSNAINTIYCQSNTIRSMIHKLLCQYAMGCDIKVYNLKQK